MLCVRMYVGTTNYDNTYVRQGVANKNQSRV
jgi:hypothetical protein